jgi:seryl-tRNA synthetase
MPIDINLLREPEKGGDLQRWRDMTQKRFKPVELVDKVVALDEQWRKASYEAQQAKRRLGEVQKVIGQKMKAKEDASAEKLQKEAIDKEIEELDKRSEALLAARDEALAQVPNELDPTVPVSNDEKDNGIVRTWGEKRASTPELLHHHELLHMIDGYEAERGVAIAGHRAYFLKGPGLLLNQALINYGLSFLSSKEYTPLQPPFFMNKDAMAGVAQLSDFDEQLYKVTGDDEKYLIATSEQPICAFHRGEWLSEKELPKRCVATAHAPGAHASVLRNPLCVRACSYAGFSSCFRKEAGSHGRDAWGIFRVHQFEKVEQFVVCAPGAWQSCARM